MATRCWRWLTVSTRPGFKGPRFQLQVSQHCPLQRVIQPSLNPLRHASGGRNISGSGAQTTQTPATASTRHRLRRLLLFGVGTGSLYLTYRIFLAPAESVPKPAKNWQVSLYRAVPLKAMSRLWGRVNQVELPVFLRKPLLGLYVWLFGCHLEEALEEDLRRYRNLADFFRRELKPGARPVDGEHALTSPSDGKVLSFGCVENGRLEQVKGVTYSLQGFLGPPTWNNNNHEDESHHDKKVSDQEYQRRLGLKADQELFHCTIYLAPGDYHRFHSPAHWRLQQRRHFPGHLLSVSPGVARWVQGLFSLNERAVYTGTWQHGFFTMCAVGATNVGSIRVYCDQELETNSRHPYQEGTYMDKVFSSAVEVPKGSMFGEFNLGSTLVLVFEAPRGFQFKVTQGQSIKCGQPLGTLDQS